MMGIHLKSVFVVSVQDRNYLSNPQNVGIDEAEACGMRYGENVGRSAIGELTRSKNKNPINPFVEGIRLISKLKELGKHLIA